PAGRLDQGRAGGFGTFAIGSGHVTSCINIQSVCIVELHTDCMFMGQRRQAMKVSSYYPVIQASDVAATADFYQRHFGFRPLFTSDWYVHLQLEGQPEVNLDRKSTRLNSSHVTI